MRALWTFIAIGFLSSFFSSQHATSESKPVEVTLFAPGLKDWTREGRGASPWRVHGDGSLTCDAAKEKLVREEIFRSGTVTIEYRFIAPGSAKPTATFGVWMAPGGDSGHQIALGVGAGSISTSFVSSSDAPKKAVEPAAAEAKLKPNGEWNTIEIVCENRTVLVKLNGVVAASSTQGNAESGLFALTADGTPFEIRKATWRAK
jgi:Domain of Unknown Function (DUF1080)